MSLIDELKRRNVFKVTAAYLALGWVVTQVTSTVAPTLHLPDWIAPVVVWIGVIGFPFVVVFSWVFELTPEGLKRESEVQRDASITHITSRRLDYIIIAMLAVAISLFVFDRFSPRHSDPVAVQPAAQTTAEASAKSTTGASSSSTSSTVDANSIAVLPFVNMSSDKEQEYFSDGISEELLNLLTKIPELEVTSRSSSFAFKGEKIDIPVLAAKLNVAHVLEGSVRKAGSRVRITVQLIDARRDKDLWSETYDRDLTDIFAVQDEIAAAVVKQLKITLLGAAPKAKVVKPEAYALFLQSRQLRRQNTPASLEQAIVLCQQALVVDPGYAEAWDELSRNYVNQASGNLRPNEEAFRLAREAVNKALALDPDNARAHDSLGWIAGTYDADPAAAARHYARALELEPANLNILGNAAGALWGLGRLNDAIAVLEFTTARDPVNTIGINNLAAAYLAAGRFDEAQAHFRTLLNLAPDYRHAHSGLGQVLLLKGDAKAALAEMQLEGDEITRLQGEAMAWHTLGQATQSDAALASLESKYATQAPFSIASAHAWRGDVDGAFVWLEKAVTAHDGSVSGISTDPLFAALDKDPRWLPFLRKTNQAPEQLVAIKFEVKLPK